MSTPQTRLEKQPHRKHPLVPEPYGERAGVDTLTVLFPDTLGNYSLARLRGKFLPEIHLKEILQSKTDQEIEDLNTRAKILSEHVTENQVRNASQSTLEADLRADLFGQVRRDPRLRMDKVPHKFRHKDPNTSRISIQTECPDITFGLATYRQAAEHKHNGGDLVLDKENIEYNPSLSEERIRKQLFHRKCGLVVNPSWGSADLIFPWAVFDAKKDSETPGIAERRLFRRIHEPASICLGMLDDLARDPKQPDKYQEGGSGIPQIFGIASVDKQLWVVTVFDWFGNYIVEPIWSGDIGELDQAKVALAIVDQIQEFAVTTHRAFVIKCLEPWIRLAEEELGSASSQNDGWALDDMGSPLFEVSINSQPPFWRELDITGSIAYVSDLENL